MATAAQDPRPADPQRRRLWLRSALRSDRAGPQGLAATCRSPAAAADRSRAADRPRRHRRPPARARNRRRPAQPARGASALWPALAGAGVARHRRRPKDLPICTCPPPLRGEPDQGWLLHPALMDLATGWAMDADRGLQPTITSGCRCLMPAVRVYRPLPAQIVSHVRNAAANRADPPHGALRHHAGHARGRGLRGDRRALPSTGWTARWPSPRPTRAASRPTRHRPPDVRRRRTPDAHLHPRHPPGRGRAGLCPRAVAGRSADHRLVAGPARPDRARPTRSRPQRPEGQTFDRPDLDTDFVEPRNDIERTLVGFWQELLGVGRVGVEDSFFDLGGHSPDRRAPVCDGQEGLPRRFPDLDPVRGADHRRLRQTDRGRGRRGAPTHDADATPPAAPQRRFTHLVPMHRGEGGAKTPFFLVAGMFGNVLNLRHLAQLLGGDRPFYGLQAHGPLRRRRAA